MFEIIKITIGSFLELRPVHFNAFLWVEKLSTDARSRVQLPENFLNILLLFYHWSAIEYSQENECGGSMKIVPLKAIQINKIRTINEIKHSK